MEDKFVFLAGLHRSGTSLLHEILREHVDISGIKDVAGAAEDEGQHIQTVYEPAKAYGGPGKFAFDKRSYMDESHPLATKENAELIFSQWSKHLDLSCRYLIEKSPPNIVRTRFLQKLFPGSKFIIILRHPLAIAYATKKWKKLSSIRSLVDHSLLAYEILFKDLEYLNSVYILKYEDFVQEPQEQIDRIYEYLDLEPKQITHVIRSNVNEKYFNMWEKDKIRIMRRIFGILPDEYEIRANKFGYSINNYNADSSC